MYSVESPSFTKKLSSLEELQYGPRFTGVGAQILGADDKYICQYSEESSNFWGSMFFFFPFLYESCYFDLSLSIVLSRIKARLLKVNDWALCMLSYDSLSESYFYPFLGKGFCFPFWIKLTSYSNNFLYY